MEDVADVLSKNERLILLRILKKLANTLPKLKSATKGNVTTAGEKFAKYYGN